MMGERSSTVQYSTVATEEGRNGLIRLYGIVLTDNP